MGYETKTPIKDSVATKMLLAVLALYLLIAIGVTLSHVWVEYRYQKENIIQDLGDIESAFMNGLAVNLWNLDEKSLRASTEGMLKIPILVGVKISNAEQVMVAIGGIVNGQDKKGNVGFHVNLSGISDEEATAHKGEPYKFELFERQFPITYDLDGKTIHLGQATIYSNSSVIYRSMKLQVAMLVGNVLLTLLTFALAILWAVNRYLRKPLGILTGATASISLDNLGSFSVDTKTSGHNEIKVLGEAMTAMVADLHEAISKREETEEELAKHRDQLELLVEDRTCELKKAQSELLQRERLATLGKLTATVSHELRNPLGTIQTALFSIEDSLERNEAHQADRPLKLAERSIDRCVNIIEELNSYTRVKGLDISEASIDDWLRGVLEEQTIPEEVHCELNLSCDVRASFDQEKLRQAVVNLITNGVHALQEKDSGGKLLQISTRLLDGEFEIRISDDGAGMSDDTILNVFEPLYSTKDFGVGLGMAIVKNIVEQHHGEISIESKKGKGTMVSLRLPIRPHGGDTQSSLP
ncbi:MAG: hypothetical protein DRH08_06345 [Deltaproteobacteria bacterium]|nr:MAG: hypothetical protein DRH08_06345 [Deltaproteobacteria bacterium]